MPDESWLNCNRFLQCVATCGWNCEGSCSSGTLTNAPIRWVGMTKVRSNVVGDAAKALVVMEGGYGGRAEGLEVAVGKLAVLRAAVAVRGGSADVVGFVDSADGNFTVDIALVHHEGEAVAVSSGNIEKEDLRKEISAGRRLKLTGAEDSIIIRKLAGVQAHIDNFGNRLERYAEAAI